MPDECVPLLGLHGWGAHEAIWQDPAGQRAVVPVQGLRLPEVTGQAQGYTVDALAIRLADACPAPAVLLGWSLGGLVAMAWALARPAQVRALVLVSSTPSFIRRHGWPHGLEPGVLDAFAGALRRDATATLRRFAALQVVGDEQARHVLADLRQRLERAPLHDPATLAAGLELLRDSDLRARVHEIRCPVLVLHGAGDAVCPVGAGRALAAAIPHARLAIHDAVGHLPFLSQPGWFYSALSAFINETCRVGA